MSVAPDDPLKDYRADYLFLLIGLNPLPNYVAARFLLRPGGILYLVQSSRAGKELTESVSRLQEVLKDYGIERTVRLPVKEADGYDIARAVRDSFVDLQRKERDESRTDFRSGGRIGLHYTGGTKAMAVHAYRALARIAQEENRQVVFSYLDANTRTLRIEPRAGERAQEISLALWPENLALGARPPSLDELARLHYEVLMEPSAPIPLLGSVVREMARLCGEKRPLREPNRTRSVYVGTVWRRWLNSQIWKAKPGRNRDGAREISGSDTGGYENWLSERESASVALDWPAPGSPEADTLRPLVTYLQRAFGLGKAPALPLAEAASHLGFTCTQLCTWLDGVWLEHYVLDILQQSAADPRIGLHECRHSLETEGRVIVSEANEKVLPKFELDVAAMRGYQLFGFSCTTSANRSLSKMKLMEALLRAQQLGGDEARIALVTFFPFSDQLRKELAQKWKVDDQIQVYGPGYLSRLPGELKNWILAG